MFGLKVDVFMFKDVSFTRLQQIRDRGAEYQERINEAQKKELR